MPEYRREGGPWQFMRNWGALREELEALAKKGEDCAVFSVRTDRFEGDENDARDHAKTRDLFARTRRPQQTAKRLPEISAEKRPQAGHEKRKEREGKEREEREERERRAQEERERRAREERERQAKEERERQAKEERERRAREERERRAKEERERQAKEERERRTKEERERRTKEERERRTKEERERREREERQQRESGRGNRKETAAAASVRGRFKAALPNAERSRAKKDQRNRWSPTWPIAAGMVALALVALVLMLRGLSNDGSTRPDLTSREGGPEVVGETVEEPASTGAENDDRETWLNPAPNDSRPRVADDPPSTGLAPEEATTSNSTRSAAVGGVSAEAVPETPMSSESRGDPECMDWNSLEYWRSATFEAARDCFEAGADVRVRAADGSTPLHYVIQGGGELAVIELLLAAGADVNAPLNDGSTPLHLAAEYAENREVVAALVRGGADPNVRNADRFNFTPLHYAAQLSKHPEVIEALLDHGADSTAESSGGLIPWDLAKDRDDLLASKVFRRLTPSGLRN